MTARSISGRTALVTGASGFIGSHLYRRLLTLGARVHAVSRQTRRSEHKNLCWWQADLGEVEAVREIVRRTRPQLLFHLGSHVAGARDLGKVLPTFYDNLASTVHLLTATAENGCERIVCANSSEEPVGFDSAVPCSPYAAAKWAGSAYARMFHALFKAPVVIPRIFMTYGPDQKDLQKLVPYVTLALLRGEAPKLSSGQRMVDWIYVEDVVEGLVKAASVEGIEGSTFDLGSGTLVSIRDIVWQIARIAGTSVQPEFGALADRPLEQERPADVAFMREKFAWQPSTSLRNGLEATVNWYRQQLVTTMMSPQSQCVEE